MKKLLLAATALVGLTAFAHAQTLQPGSIYWGANGHRDQGGIYATTSLSQQIADLKTVFGSTPNTVFYRYSSGDGYSGLQSDAVALKAGGIIPLAVMLAFPNWAGYANEAAAYSSAYSAATAIVKSAPALNVWEIGNEWDLQTTYGPITRGVEAGA